MKINITSFNFTPKRIARYKDFLPFYINGIEYRGENGRIIGRHPLRYMLMETKEGLKRLSQEYAAAFKYFKNEGYKDIFFSHWEEIPIENQRTIKIK